MSSPRTYDAVIIGAGHNGLTTAGYLARAGLKVKVLERRPVVGGAAVTEEFYPGFRNSVCSYVVSMLSPEVIKDLELERYGLQLIKRASGMMSALPNGKHLIISRDQKATHAEISKFSVADADRHAAFEEEIDQMALIFRKLANERPPNIGGGITELFYALKTGSTLWRLSSAEMEKLTSLMTMSLGDYLNNWFESDEVKGYYAGDGATGDFSHPYSAGSAYILLHHAFGMINGELGAWWHSKGGMGGITQAMAKSATAQGVEIEISCPVAKVITDNGVASGVVLEDGCIIHAKTVAANCTPKLLFMKLMDPASLPADFLQRIKNWRCKSGSFRMNVALSELPKITSLAGVEGAEAHMQRSININPSIAYMERAWIDARTYGFSKHPYVSMNIPSLIDNTLAPKGMHVASLFCQHFNPDLPEATSWDQLKSQAIETIIDTVTAIAPNFRKSILGFQALSPLDLEREFSLTGGDIFHGALHLDQLYSLRPAAGYADYRTPVKN
ncbi:MAG: NAD(P)/FAD-dependent oxidoreductase, partial [Proteobacteria bacterium]|nr:NAD(P)/FAD-dependent oxidoreductase [Pseudomonadota bacterium]